MPDYKQKKLPTAVIAIKVTLKKGTANLRRNPAFAEAFTYFYTELVKVLIPEERCLEIKQVENKIFVIWNCEDNSTAELVRQYFVMQRLKFRTTSKYGGIVFRLLIAIDFEFTNVVFLESYNRKSEPLLLQGDSIDHTEKILSSISGSKYPLLFMTHAFRSILPEFLRNVFSCPFYFYHICCYCNDKRKQGKPFEALHDSLEYNVKVKLST